MALWIGMVRTPPQSTISPCIRRAYDDGRWLVPAGRRPRRPALPVLFARSSRGSLGQRLPGQQCAIHAGGVIGDESGVVDPGEAGEGLADARLRPDAHGRGPDL